MASRAPKTLFPALAGTVLAGLLAFLPLSARAETALRGDLNRDGSITIADATLALRAAVGSVTLDADAQQLADVNGDGKLTIADATTLLQRVIGKIPDLGTLDLGGPAESPFTAIVQNNETVFEWPKSGKGVITARFTQGSRKVEITHNVEGDGDRDRFRLLKRISRQLLTGDIGNEYALFAGFTADSPVHVEFLGSNSILDTPVSLGNLDIKAVPHAFDPGVYADSPSEISLDHSFSNTAKIGDVITLSGLALPAFPNGLRSSAFITLPSGVPHEVPCGSSQPFDTQSVFGPKIAPGHDFHMSFPIESEGTYTVEINDYAGSAAFNQPIYVGSGLPLLPGNLDVQAAASTSSALDMTSLQQDWLNLINQERAKFGLQPIVFDEQLMNAAQAHASDMVTKNYFGHIGMDGSDPTSRALQFGVPATTLVDENITQGTNLTGMEAGLMASAVHRSNILNPDWTRVGLGIARTATGLLLGDQEFAAAVGEYHLPVDYFNHITLDQAVSSSFKAGQAETVSGQVDTTVGAVIVFFISTSGQQIIFQATPDNTGHFSAQVQFTAAQAGNYQMGIALNGSSRAANVVVKPA